MGKIPNRRLFWSIFVCLVVLLCARPQKCFSQSYDGYRIGLFNFELVGKKKKTLRCSAVNTGREALSFDKNKPAPENLIVEVDSISLPEELRSKRQFVRLALFQTRVRLNPGEMMSDLELDVGDIKSNGNEPVVKETKPQKPEKTEPVLIAETKESEKPSVTEKTEQPDQPKTELSDAKGGVASSSSSTFFDYDKQCPDLTFDSVWVIDVNEKDLILGFIIHNQGQKPARITGKKKGKSDNVAVNIYFTSGTRLTRGALLADGIFIGDSRDNPEGILAANGRMGGEIKVSAENRTRFSPNVVFELDPFFSLLECDETNNTMSLEIPY